MSLRSIIGYFLILRPFKIIRKKESFIDLHLFKKACPSFIKVDKVNTVISDECSTCLSCVDVCPIKNTLEVKSVVSNRKISKKFIAAGIVVIYFIIITIGMISGNWQNNIDKEEYLNLFERKNKIGHIRSSDDINNLNKRAESKFSK